MYRSDSTRAQAAMDASPGGGIVVLGTPATIQSHAYVDAIHTLHPGRLVVQIQCPLFVPLVEEGWLEHSVTSHEVVREYLKSLRGQSVDTIILGCTHYPLLAKVIREVACDILKREIHIVDSAQSVARVVADSLENAEIQSSASVGTHRFL